MNNKESICGIGGIEGIRGKEKPLIYKNDLKFNETIDIDNWEIEYDN